MTTMRGLLVLALALALVPVSAAARQPTYVTHDCSSAKTRPRQIMFACADGGYYVNHLKWRFWHKRKAVARGVYHANDCEPSCAEGTFHKRRGKLVLRARMWCKNIDAFVFRRAKVCYDRPLFGTRRARVRLFCPLL
jgi:hypothetical protein